MLDSPGVTFLLLSQDATRRGAWSSTQSPQSIGLIHFSDKFYPETGGLQCAFIVCIVRRGLYVKNLLVTEPGTFELPYLLFSH